MSAFPIPLPTRADVIYGWSLTSSPVRPLAVCDHSVHSCTHSRPRSLMEPEPNAKRVTWETRDSSLLLPLLRLPLVQSPPSVPGLRGAKGEWGERRRLVTQVDPPLSPPQESAPSTMTTMTAAALADLAKEAGVFLAAERAPDAAAA